MSPERPTSRPAPRPALRKAPDGSVHPASTRLSSLAVDAEAIRAAAKGKPGKGKVAERGKGGGKGGAKTTGGGSGKAADVDQRVDLTVSVPRSVRKRLRRKAEAHGWTAEEAAAHVLRAWVDD